MRRAVVASIAFVACGRIGFDRGSPAADAPAAFDASAIDALPICVYLPTCTPSEVTCCTNATTRSCIPTGSECTGAVAACDVATWQGCPTSWPCCQTQMEPQPRCYNPMLPVPC